MIMELTLCEMSEGIMVAGVVGLKGSLLTPKGLELSYLTANETQLKQLNANIF
jgi:hypothetical protein